ncbi:lipopolysaccharide biosynthesis protein [Paracoccus sp. DMF-8]|uniref:GumC family protein n=1 Tax=Paracoccus sp. DMF-8 TaxID=3019445 RepID=UPI0023E8D881|nr:lipopolysaccharide biosynthesis protein [Paracoccus sp. DMF-8]MDF3606757.1 lipopolysaccharide biosynthesis protein [Paracoccus sp. DMF-8]
MTILAIGILGALYLAVTSPRVYEAVAVIQIEAPAIVDSTNDAGLPAARRVQLIEQRLMVRANVLDVIERHQLYVGLPLSENAKIALFRGSTRIESVQATGRDPTSGASLVAIVISVQAETAQKAADLANDFADSIIGQDEASREARVQETREFLLAEERRIERELDAHGRRMADYNTQNEDALPSAQEYIQQELTQLAEQEAALDREIMSLDRERLAVRAGDGMGLGRTVSSLAQQLRVAELELAQARRTFSADHPEIARLEANISRLSEGGVSEPSGIVQQVQLIDTQLQQLRQQIAQISARQGEIERARARTPEVRREVEQMTREQMRLQDRYAETSRRLAEVEMLQSLQENNQVERFVVLERAVPPEYPALSGRKKSALLGGLVTLMIAGGVALLLDLRQPVLRSSSQFIAATGLRPVVELAYVPDEKDLLTTRITWYYLACLTVATLIAMVWLAGYLPGVPSPGVVGPMGSGGA